MRQWTVRLPFAGALQAVRDAATALLLAVLFELSVSKPLLWLGRVLAKRVTRVTKV